MGSTSLGECFRESFLARNQNPAITFLRDGRVETQLSYIELERDKNRMAAVFQNLGVEKGDRVILLISKSLILVIAHLALQGMGAISVPLNPGFKKSELEYLLQDAEAKIILAEPGKEALIREIDPNLTTLTIDNSIHYQDMEIFQRAAEEFRPVQIGSEDPALIIYTSGTTGSPKGTILGCFIPPAAVILMVAPLLLPIIQGLGFDPIWFAVIMTVNLEIGLVTPPVGLNLYIVKNIAPDVPMSHVLLGVIPFVIIEFMVIICVCIWPELALWLPNKMIG